MRALLLSLIAIGPAVPTDPEHVPTHAVMFEFDYTADGDIRHAQAVGGYPSLDACRTAMPAQMGNVLSNLNAGRIPQLLCSGIHEHVVIGTLPKVKT